MFNYKKSTIMKAKNFKNGVSVIIKSDDLNLNDVVVNLNKETKSETTSVKDTEPITSESHNINKVVPADETKR